MVQIDLDELYEIRDAVAAHRQVIQAAIDGGLSLDEAERLAKLVNEQIEKWDIRALEYRAQRYLKTMFIKWAETKIKLRAGSTFASDDEKSLSVQPTGFAPLPEDQGLARTLLIAVYAYMKDCETMGTEAAWSALPAFEQERLREASRYIPVNIPDEEEECDDEEDEDVEEDEDEEEGI
jgi:hypothetical protein